LRRREGNMTMIDLRYPIGRFHKETGITSERRQALIDGIARLPVNLRAAVNKLSDQQLDTPYRPGGWTVRQVIHHVPDSHLNAYLRFKLALTESEPTIKPYDEKQWAELPDARLTPIEVSLSLLDNLHARWILLLRALEPAAFSKTFRHPDLGILTLDTQLGLYEWHGRHHLAHITCLRSRLGWN
jgi:DinB superfamily